MKTLLCTIVKNENLYLQEFIDHYKELGVSHIILYDNNDIDGEEINIKDKKVSIVNVRGKHVYQLPVYNQCYEEYKSKYDWILFFDCDEFLYLDYRFRTIDKYLSDPMFDRFDCIKINWKVFGDNNIEQIVNNNYSVKRFKTPVSPDNFIVTGMSFPQNYHIKSIVRCKENLNIDWKNPHCPFGINYLCDNKGKPTGNTPFEIPDYTYAVIAHYHTKTINEYIKKIDRGYADIQRIYNKEDLRNILYLFFDYNKKTNYKVNQIEEYLKNKIL